MDDVEEVFGLWLNQDHRYCLEKRLSDPFTRTLIISSSRSLPVGLQATPDNQLVGRVSAA
jgi:hypothetical protein